MWVRPRRRAIWSVIVAVVAGAGLAGCSSRHHTPSAVALSPTTTVASATSRAAVGTATQCPVATTPATGLGSPLGLALVRILVTFAGWSSRSKVSG
jgi:hypothetical protein